MIPGLKFANLLLHALELYNVPGALLVFALCLVVFDAFFMPFGGFLAAVEALILIDMFSFQHEQTTPFILNTCFFCCGTGYSNKKQDKNGCYR